MVWKKIAATVLVLTAIIIIGYVLILAQVSNQVRGVNNGNGLFGAPGVRELVVLSTIGGSAFITGFGLRDVIGRAVAARQRSRIKAAREQQQGQARR